MEEKNMERDCIHCVHYKHLHDDIFSCEKWECQYERREEDEQA